MTWNAARYWPNEEVARFLGRTYGEPDRSVCRGIAIDLGCGIGGNIIALDKQGFLVRGYDLSVAAIEAGDTWLRSMRVHGYRLFTRDLVAGIPEESQSLELVLDVQCLQHLSLTDREKVYHEVWRVLRPGARFFTYQWLDGDRDQIFPDHPELQPQTSVGLQATLEKHGYRIDYCEHVEKTYQERTLWARWAVVVAVKP